MIVFLRSIFFEESTFTNVLQILGGNFLGFRRHFSSTVVRNALDSRFSIGFMLFFRTLRRVLLAGLSALHSTCPQECFQGKHLLWNKNTFQILFRILNGDFSGFRRHFYGTVVRTALDSRFLIRYMPYFCGVHANFYWSVCQNSTLRDRDHRFVFMECILWKKTVFQLFFTIYVEPFQVFGKTFPELSPELHWFLVFSLFIVPIFSEFTQILMIGLSELHSMCPKDCFHGKHFLWKKNTFQILFRILDEDVSGFRRHVSSTEVRTALDSRFSIGFMLFFRTLRRVLLAGLSALHSTCPQDCFQGKHLLWNKNTFQILFRILDGDFSAFRRHFSSTVVRTALNSRYSIGLMPVFFGIHSKIYWLVCQNCTLRVHRIVFMGSIFFERNTFQIVLHILDGNFLVFGQIFSSTVVGSEMDSRYFNRIYANFFRTLRKFFLAGLSDLHSPCRQDCFHGKNLHWKKLFDFYFAFWMETFQVFGDNFPAR